MHYRALGRTGWKVSEISFGAWAIGGAWGQVTDEESLGALNQAIDSGINFLDTADVYGPYKNEELVGRAIKGKRNQIVLATKFGIVRDPKTPNLRALNGKPDYVRQSCEGSLRRPATRGARGRVLSSVTQGS